MHSQTAVNLLLLILAVGQLCNADEESIRECGNDLQVTPEEYEKIRRDFAEYRESRPKLHVPEVPYIQSKALLVEYDDEERSRLQLVLDGLKTRYGLMNVVTASSSEEAKRLGLEEDIYVIIISNFDPPDGDGIELAQYFGKEKKGKFWRIAIGCRGSDEDFERIGRCKHSQFHAHITKPEIWKLDRLLRSYLRTPRN
eukprot:TRINITY_DN733_c0_g2_i3.p1 TRINITY_DN733_c0_g2~~TRINITY_DN733_c0_g2_i3.p1  ORF type:complete len:198 (+),score=25.82 TRINITY_DN733_c0_g2_i3:31-624(+)